MANDSVVEEIRFHEETIANDNKSPLHLIREKELEISGRLLAAKRQADEVVADARRKAAEIVAAAEAEGGAGAKATAGSLIDDARSQARQLEAEAQTQAADIALRVDSRMDAAVGLIVDAVKAV